MARASRITDKLIAVARAAAAEGLAPAQAQVDNPVPQVHQAMWRPEYPRLETKPL